MKRIGLGALLILSVLSTSANAKVQVTRITVESEILSAPIEISDAQALAHFSPWGGFGAWGDGGQQTRGFIVDWGSGIVAPPADTRSMFKVSFYARHGADEPEKLAYAVTYTYLPYDREREAVYLPGKDDPRYALNVSSIFRGVEGKWFRPTSEWQSLVRPLIGRALSR
jgi:hypothetical protein